jgi:CDP-glucose 4,6-dehydratase
LGQRQSALESVGLTMSRVDPKFWAGRRVLLTGHTGFKGAWASLWLTRMGAKLTGLSLAPEAGPSLFALAGVAGDVAHHLSDIRDAAAVQRVVADAKPEIILHMAAQSLVRRSYRDPAGTFATNVQGTINLLDAVRALGTVHTVLVVTSDKVYENRNDGRAFVEGDRLGGSDPYSASKAACELAVASYAQSFFDKSATRVATVRGGNVIGGGDFSEDRIVPDIYRSAVAGRAVEIRSPNAVRPWQHVLDCLAGYFIYIQHLQANSVVPNALNIGPLPEHPVTVKALTERMLAALGNPVGLEMSIGDHPPEKLLLTVDAALARQMLGWGDQLMGPAAIDWTAAWYRGLTAGSDVRQVTQDQINQFMAATKEA